MSAYEVAKLCRRALREPDLRERLTRAPAETVEREAALTDAERTALLAGEVGRLFELGCVAFLLSYLPRWGLFGLDVALYSERMRAAVPPVDAAAAADDNRAVTLTNRG